ncbi:MAG: hypothetical protein U0V70_19755 [Terriglobia bacterium]
MGRAQRGRLLLRGTAQERRVACLSRDFTKHKAIKDSLNLNDHGNELIGGVAELYVITKASHPEKAERYREPLRKPAFNRLLAKARNEDGLWYNFDFVPQPASHSTRRRRIHGLRVPSGTTTFAMATDDQTMLAA